MNAKNDEHALQSSISELKKITIFQIASLVAIFIMGLIIVSYIIGSTLWLWLLLIIFLAAGIISFVLLIIIPTSKLEDFLRMMADENANLTIQISDLKEQLANLQIHLPQQPETQAKDKPIEDIVATEPPNVEEDIFSPIEQIACSIIQPGDGMNIRETCRILVESTVSDLIAKVAISFDDGEYIDITNQFDGAHYYYDWEIEELESGVHTNDARVVDNSATPQIADAEQVKIEIDNLVKKLQVNIKTDKETYQIDSMLRVEVTVKDDLGVEVQNAVVDMTIYDSDNSIQAAGQGMTNTNGVAYFGSEIMVDDPIGTYTIEAGVSKEEYESGMESTSFKVESVMV